MLTWLIPQSYIQTSHPSKRTPRLRAQEQRSIDRIPRNQNIPYHHQFFTANRPKTELFSLFSAPRFGKIRTSGREFVQSMRLLVPPGIPSTGLGYSRSDKRQTPPDLIDGEEGPTRQHARQPRDREVGVEVKVRRLRRHLPVISDVPLTRGGVESGAGLGRVDEALAGCRVGAEQGREIGGGETLCDKFVEQTLRWGGVVGEVGAGGLDGGVGAADPGFADDAEGAGYDGVGFSRLVTLLGWGSMMGGMWGRVGGWARRFVCERTASELNHIRLPDIVLLSDGLELLRDGF